MQAIMSETGVYIFFNFCRASALLYLVTACFQERRVHKLVLAGIASCYFLVNSILFLYCENAVLNLSATVLYFIALSCCFVANLQRKLLIVTLLTVVCMVYETALFALFIKVFGVQSLDVFPQVVLILLFLLTANIMKKTNAPQTDATLGRFYWSLIIFMPIGSIAILLLLCTIATNRWQCMMIATILLVFNSGVVSIYNLAVRSMFAQKQAETLDLMNQAYRMQLETIQTVQRKTTAIRHDMKNHILSMQTLLQAEKTDELSHYLLRFQDVLQVDKQWANTTNVALDSFINYKLFQMEKINAKVHCTIQVDTLEGFDIFDLSAILGNMFDNAYEALCKTEHRTLDFAMKTGKSVLYITLTNTYTTKIIRRNQIIQTSKANDAEHGFGLQNIQTMVECYHGVFELSETAHEVTASCMLYSS